MTTPNHRFTLLGIGTRSLAYIWLIVGASYLSYGLPDIQQQYARDKESATERIQAAKVLLESQQGMPDSRKITCYGGQLPQWARFFDDVFCRREFNSLHPLASNTSISAEEARESYEYFIDEQDEAPLSAALRRFKERVFTFLTFSFLFLCGAWLAQVARQKWNDFAAKVRERHRE